MYTKEFRKRFGEGSDNPHIKLMTMGNADYDHNDHDSYNLDLSHIPKKHKFYDVPKKPSAQNPETSTLQNDSNCEPNGLAVPLIPSESSSTTGVEIIKDQSIKAKTFSVSKTGSKSVIEKNSSSEKKELVFPPPTQ